MADEGGGQKLNDEAAGDPLALERVLKPTPSVALIKDDEPSDGKEPPDRFGTAEVAERLSEIVEQIETALHGLPVWAVGRREDVGHQAASGSAEGQGPGDRAGSLE